jgi:Spy/CpxP family protein refolding chaperone
MLNKTLALLLVFSLAFNIAFLAIWAHGRRARTHEDGADAILPAPEDPPGEQPRERPRPGGRRDRGRGDRLWEELGVSDEQKQQLGESYEKLRTTTEALRQEARTHREALYKLLESELPDRDAVLAEQEAIDSIGRQQSRAVIEQMLEMREILTPEQRQAWLQKMREVRERVHRRGRFGRPRPDGNASGGPEPGPDAIGPGAMPRGERPDGPGRPPMPEGGMP